MALGKVQPDAKGIWKVSEVPASSIEPKPSASPQKPAAALTIVSNTQQSVDQAKASQKRKRKESKSTLKNPKKSSNSKPGAWIRF